MKKVLLLCLLATSICLQAQTYSKVKISLDAAHTMQQLAALGLDVDHGRLQPGKYFIGEFSQAELAQMVGAGFRADMLVADLEAHRHEPHPATDDRALPPCPDLVPTNYQTPANYQAGTMGGYFKYSELLSNLDLMATMYPNIVKARQPISSVNTTI